VQAFANPQGCGNTAVCLTAYDNTYFTTFKTNKKTIAGKTMLPLVKATKHVKSQTKHRLNPYRRLPNCKTRLAKQYFLQ
jgi:hypothetical protein